MSSMSVFCAFYVQSPRNTSQPDLLLFSSSHVFHSDQNIRFCDLGYTLCFATSLLLLTCFPDSEVSSPKSSHLFICYLIFKTLLRVTINSQKSKLRPSSVKQSSQDDNKGQQASLLGFKCNLPHPKTQALN